MEGWKGGRGGVGVAWPAPGAVNLCRTTTAEAERRQALACVAVSTRHVRPAPLNLPTDSLNGEPTPARSLRAEQLTAAKQLTPLCSCSTSFGARTLSTLEPAPLHRTSGRLQSAVHTSSGSAHGRARSCDADNAAECLTM